MPRPTPALKTLGRWAVWAGVLAAGLLALQAGLTEIPDPFAWQVRADRWLPEVPTVRRLEQTFTPGRDGLAGVDILVNPGAGRPGQTLTVRLAAEADGRELASVPVALGGPSGPTAVSLRFAAQPASAGRPYRLVAAAGGEPLPPGLVAAAGDDPYPEGQLAADGVPVPGSLRFRAYYRPDPGRLVTAVAGSFNDIPAAAMAVGLWLLPGLGISALLGWPETPGLTGRLAAGSSFSLAFWPLVYYWAGVRGLPAFEAGLGLGVGLAGAAAVRRGRSFRPPGTAPDPAEGLFLGAVLILTLLVRLYPLGDLALTPWVDGPHHALITRKILEANRVPDSYGPEVKIPAFYHFGFHVHAAFIARITGAEPAGAIGLAGQLLSAWSAVLACWLVREWAADARAGLVGAGLAGLILTFPGYLLSWSRFSLAAGLDLLPAVLLAGRDWVRSDRAAGAVGILLAGLALTHYRLLVMAGLFLLLLTAFSWKGAGPHSRLGARLMLALGGFLPALPWLGLAAGRFLLPAVRASLQAGPDSEPFPWDLVARWPDGAVFLLALGALLAGIRRARSDALALGLTLLGLGFLAGALPVPSPLPNVVDGVTVAASLWLAALAPAGAAVAWLLDRVRLGGKVGLPAVGTLVLVACCSQVGRQLAAVNPELVLVHPADLPALVWVRANTPPDAGFLINGFQWRPGFYAGADAGFWLPAAAGRTTLLPTLLYGNLPAEEFARRNRIARELAAGPADWGRLIPELRALKVDYVFIGRRGGPLTAGKLLGRPEFEPVYHQAGVWVFRLRPP